jgi:hypothetical protein
VTIELLGHIPGKKNLLRRSRNGGLHRDAEVTAQIDDLVLQAACQWRRRTPLEHPRIVAEFYVRDRRGDLDNKWTTVQDVLVRAGVLRNDNLAHLRGPVTFSGRVDQRERVVVRLEGTNG